MGVNAAGLQSKMTSFKNVLEDLKPSLFRAYNSKFIASMYRPNNKKEAKRWRC